MQEHLGTGVRVARQAARGVEAKRLTPLLRTPPVRTGQGLPEVMRLRLVPAPEVCQQGIGPWRSHTLTPLPSEHLTAILRHGGNPLLTRQYGILTLPITPLGMPLLFLRTEAIKFRMPSAPGRRQGAVWRLAPGWLL